MIESTSEKNVIKEPSSECMQIPHQNDNKDGVFITNQLY
jgi:hypothetical protein